MGIMYRCSLGGGGETCEFIAPDYDANKTDYAADDVVLKDGKVMKYNGSEWEDFSLAECTTLNSNLGGDYNVSTTITWYVGATNKVYMSVRTLVTDKNNKTILDQSKVIYDWADNALDIWYNPTVNFTLET